MKTYKLSYKGKDGKEIKTFDLNASDISEALIKSQVLLKSCLDKRVEKVEVKR